MVLFGETSKRCALKWYVCRGCSRCETNMGDPENKISRPLAANCSISCKREPQKMGGIPLMFPPVLFKEDTCRMA